MSTLFVVFEDFILSREAMLCSPQTIDFYRRMLKPFLALANGSPPTNQMVREFLSTVAQRGVSSATVHAHARAVRAFLRFAYEEDWIEEPVIVRMPRVEQKRMEVLSREDARQVLSVCGTRDRALVMTLIDSGIRRGEALALTWEDIDLHTGAVHVQLPPADGSIARPAQGKKYGKASTNASVAIRQVTIMTGSPRRIH